MSHNIAIAVETVTDFPFDATYSISRMSVISKDVILTGHIVY